MQYNPDVEITAYSELHTALGRCTCCLQVLRTADVALRVNLSVVVDAGTYKFTECMWKVRDLGSYNP